MTQPSVNPSGRVQVIASPIASPGQCGLCGKASHERGFVAPDLNFEFYGTLIFCYDCVGDMCAQMGYFGPNELDTLRHQVEDQNAELDMLRKAILGLESAVDGLTNYRDASGASLGNRGSVAVRPDVPTLKPEQPITPTDPPEPVKPPGGTAGVRTVAEPQPRQPVSVAGPDDVLDVDATLSDLGLDLGDE